MADTVAATPIELQITMLKRAATKATGIRRATADKRLFRILQELAVVTEIHAQLQHLQFFSAWFVSLGAPIGALFGWVAYQFLKTPATLGGGLVGGAVAGVANAGITVANTVSGLFSRSSNATASQTYDTIHAVRWTADYIDEFLDATSPHQLKTGYILLWMCFGTLLFAVCADAYNRLVRQERRQVLEWGFPPAAPKSHRPSLPPLLNS